MLSDLRFAVRSLLKAPLFTIVVIATIALGIAANTAIFSVVHAVLLAPPPFSEPERLAVVWETDRNTGTTREPGILAGLSRHSAQLADDGRDGRVHRRRDEPESGTGRSAARAGADMHRTSCFHCSASNPSPAACSRPPRMRRADLRSP